MMIKTFNIYLGQTIPETETSCSPERPLQRRDAFCSIVVRSGHTENDGPIRWADMATEPWTHVKT